MINITEQSGRQIITFGLLMCLNQPIYQALWYFESVKNYQNTFLRTIASLLSLSLVFNRYWPKSCRAYLPIVWYFALCFCLPFFFTFMSLKSYLSTTWMMNSMSALFFMFLLIDFISASVLIILGTLIGFYVFTLTTPVLIIAPGIISLKGLAATFLAAFIIGGIFARNNEIIRQEKFETLHSISANVAHEFRTPLAAIKFAMSGLQKYLPSLLSGYKAAQQAELTQIPKISKNNIVLLQSMPKRIDNLLYQANLSIDMMLMNAKQLRLSQVESTEIIIKDCLFDAIKQYPFKSKQQRTLLHIAEDFSEFKCIGSKLLVLHIFFNLLKNALYYIDANRKGEIFLWTESTARANKVYFKDTAQGISVESQKNLFKQFRTSRAEGTGIGLSFCKMVMDSMGGEISCESKFGVHATFILSFPKIIN